MTWVGPSLAAGAYDTHLLRGGQRVVEPFASVAMLRREDGAWRLASVMRAMTHDRWRFRLPGSRDDAGGWGLGSDGAESPDRGGVARLTGRGRQWLARARTRERPMSVRRG